MYEDPVVVVAAVLVYGLAVAALTWAVVMAGDLYLRHQQRRRRREARRAMRASEAETLIQWAKRAS